MPGAWEINVQPQVFVGVLTREIVTTAWANGYRNLNLPPNSAIGNYAGMPFDHARNNACEDALRGGYQYIFFLDDDVIAPADAVLRLIAQNLDIVSGLYYRRHEGLQPCMQNVNGGWVVDVPFGRLVEVGVMGAGCLLIRRRVLETIPRPWFEWRCDRIDLPEGKRYSEDFTFMIKAREHGFRPIVDTTVVCKHVGLGTAGPQGFAPLKLT